MSKEVRYKCKSCCWVGYRFKEGLKKPCPWCGTMVERCKVKPQRLFTPEEDEKLKELSKNYGAKTIAKMIGRSEASVAGRRRLLGIRLPREKQIARMATTQFKKGQVSWSEGLKLPGRKNITTFRKGNLPANTLYDGAVTFRKRNRKGNQNYLFIRIGKGKWELLHRYVWKKSNGTIPKGMVIRFKDGDHLNCDIKNLELISRKESLMRNGPGPKKDLIWSDRYIAARLKVMGKEKQLKFIQEHPELIEAKRQQLFLRRSIVNATGRKA